MIMNKIRICIDKFDLIDYKLNSISFKNHVFKNIDRP